MERCTKLVIILLFVGCQFSVDYDVRVEDLTEREKEIVGLWRYDKIFAKRNEYEFADRDNEPTFIRNQSRILARRYIRYTEEKVYELVWFEPFGRYQLGTEDHPSWQPDFGAWKIEGSKLTHNASSDYEVLYNVQISNNSMGRTYQRIMSSNTADWSAGDTLVITETFVRIK